MLRRQLLKALVALAALPLAPLAKLAPKFQTGGLIHDYQVLTSELHSGCHLAEVARMPMLEFDCHPSPWTNKPFVVDVIVDRGGVIKPDPRGYLT